LAAAAGSDLVLTLPRKLEGSRCDGEVRSVEPPPEINSVQYFMIWHPRLTAEPARVWFREQLADSRQDDSKISGSGESRNQTNWEDPSSLFSDLPWITQCPREFDFENAHWPKRSNTLVLSTTEKAGPS